MNDPAKRLARLAMLFDEHGVPERGDRLRLIRDHAGRFVTSSKQLTVAERESLIARLEQLPRGGLPSHVARLHREEEAAARQWVTDAAAGKPVPFVCGRGGEPTEADLQVVAEFGEQLELLAERGVRPPAARDPQMET